jgi:hypothetical protein
MNWSGIPRSSFSVGLILSLICQNRRTAAGPYLAFHSMGLLASDCDSSLTWDFEVFGKDGTDFSFDWCSSPAQLQMYPLRDEDPAWHVVIPAGETHETAPDLLSHAIRIHTLPYDRETSWRISVRSLGVIGCDVGVGADSQKQSICWDLSDNTNRVQQRWQHRWLDWRWCRGREGAG